MIAPLCAPGGGLAFQHALFGPRAGLLGPRALGDGRRPQILAHKPSGTPWGLRGPGAPARGGVRLGATKGEDEAARRGGRKGFYVRPSKAVELGGGFYVPGLEGPRLRVAIGILALALLALNRLTLPAGYEPLESQVASEAVTGVTTLLLLGQALFEAATGGQGVAIGVGEDAEEAAEARPSVVRSSERLAGRGADDELWVLATAMEVLPASTAALTLDGGGFLAACSPEVCGDEQGGRAHAAGVRLVGGRAAVGIDRGEGGADAQEVLALLPDSCKRALVCGGEARVVVLGLPGGAPEVGGNQALWISQLAALPTA